jgi:hypothetical protein
MKASEKARKKWNGNPRKPFYAKRADKHVWIDFDRKPRVPSGGPKRKR